MLFVLRLWIVAWMCTPSSSRNLPLIMAATEPTAVMEGSEFDKAFAVVNSMFEQIARVPGHLSGKDHVWNKGSAQAVGDFIGMDIPSTEASSKETSAPDTYYIKAKDSDFIMIDPLRDDDRNAAALSKMVQGSYNARQRQYQEDQERAPLPLEESGEDHEVAATEDSKEQDDSGNQEDRGDHEEDHDQERDHGDEEGDHGDEEDDHGDQEEDPGQQDVEDQGPGPEDDQGGEEEEEVRPVRHSRGKDRESRDVDEQEEPEEQEDPEEEEQDDDDAPLEGAPVTEEDLDDFAPETFMPPTVLGVARHYKLGSAFSVFPVHIPNAPEHIELGDGVPTESQEEGEDEEEEPPKEAEQDEEEGEDMEPDATTTSHGVVVAAASEEDKDDGPVSSKKGHRVSEHDEDETHWIGEGGEHEADEVEHDTHADNAEDDESGEKFKHGEEKSSRYKNEGGAKNEEDLKEAYIEGKHDDDSAGEEEDGEDEHDGYGKRKMQKGFHDKYNFDSRTSKNTFYKNRRKKGDWKDAGEDEHIFYKDTEGDERGSFGKYKVTSEDSGSHEDKEGGHSTKKKDKWKKSKGGGKTDETSSAYEKGKASKSGKGYYSWE